MQRISRNFGVMFIVFLLCAGFFGMSTSVSCAKEDVFLGHGPYCASEQLVASFGMLEHADQTALPSVWKFILTTATVCVLVRYVRVTAALDPAIRFRRRFLHPILSHRRPFISDIFLPAFAATHGF